MDVGFRDPVGSVGLGREVSPGGVDVAGLDASADGLEAEPPAVIVKLLVRADPGQTVLVIEGVGNVAPACERPLGVVVVGRGSRRKEPVS